MFGSNNWTYNLLTQLNFLLAFYCIWRLAREVLPPMSALAAVCLLEFVPYFSFFSMRLNHSSMLIPIWALTILLGYFAIQRDQYRYWIALGLISGVAMQMHGAALLGLVWIDAGFAVVIFIVLHGLAWGVRGPQMQAIRADYFGSTSFASIMGWSNIIVTMGAIAGPLIAGSLADATGDYRLGFTILGVAAACGTVFWIFATPPSEPT